MEKAVSDGRCDARLIAKRPNEVKIIGRPDSLTSVGVHDVKLSAAFIHPPYGIYHACITERRGCSFRHDAFAVLTKRFIAAELSLRKVRGRSVARQRELGAARVSAGAGSA